MILCQTRNSVNSFHEYVRGPLTSSTKDILWMDDGILNMTYESLDMGSLKCHRLDMT